MHYCKKSRRQFLRGLGGVTVALPFLPSLMSSEALAAGTVAPKRFLLIHSGHCQAVEQWHPDYSKLSFTQSGAYARSASLTSMSGSVSPVLSSAFDSLKSKLLLLSRLDPSSSQPNHNAEVTATGGVLSEASAAGVDSIDQVLARVLTGQAPLNLYVRAVNDQYYNGAAHVSVKSGQYSPGLFNPSAVFQSLFGVAGSSTTTTSVDTNKLSRRNLLVVDRVLAEYKSLRSNPKLSKNDGILLDQTMTMLSSTQSNIQSSITTAPVAAPILACKSPTGPANSPILSSNPADYQVVIDQMFDVIEVGMKCGKVQVATLMMHVYDYFAGTVGFIPNVSGNVRMHEDIGHAGTPELRAMKLLLNQWFAQRVARFLTNMNVIEDNTTGATYLDNSLTLWANDQGATSNAGAHLSMNLPVLLAGSAGGFFKTGKYIDYGPALDSSLGRAVGGDEGQYKMGRPYNQLLLTIAQSMGLQPSDYEKAGVQGFGVYGGRTTNFDYLPGNHRRELLPLVTG